LYISRTSDNEEPFFIYKVPNLREMSADNIFLFDSEVADSKNYS